MLWELELSDLMLRLWGNVRPWTSTDQQPTQQEREAEIWRKHATPEKEGGYFDVVHDLSGSVYALSDLANFWSMGFQ